MFSKCGSNHISGAREFILCLIMLLLSNSKHSESHIMSMFSAPVLYHQPSLKLQPYVSTQASPLQNYRCRIFQQCGDRAQKYSRADYQTSKNLKNGNHSINPKLGVTVYPYLPISRKFTTKKNYDSHYVIPSTQRNNVILNRPIYTDLSSQLNTPVNNYQVPKPSTFAPELKQIAQNTITKVISHILNTKRQESRKLSPPENDIHYVSRSGMEKPADAPKENIPKNEINVSNTSAEHTRKSLLNEFRQGLDRLERKFYTVTFTKLTNITTGARAENSISFVQSALFLQLLLLTLSVGRNVDTKLKIDKSIGIKRNISDVERTQLIEEVVSMLPSSTDGLVFRWSSRLVLGSKYNVSADFRNGPAAALQLHLDQFNGTETPEILSDVLNRMVEEDSKGAIHNTFDPEDLTGTVRAVFLTTLYLRSRWRAAPTLLNGTRVFRDSHEDPNRTIRMIRVNDVMAYANLTDCDAEAFEVFYLKQGLSLLILVPYGSSLRRLAAYVAEAGLGHITSQMRTLRVAADLPLYTLRMTLLLPNKLEGLGLSDLLHVDNSTDNDLKMSHGLQRLMFWAEAGRNAFKDDGIEWDDPPDIRTVIDRPYLFFVRWNNMSLMNGNFVL